MNDTLPGLAQLLTSLGVTVPAIGAAIAYICKRLDSYMTQRAQEERSERAARSKEEREEREQFRSFLFEQERTATRQTEKALETLGEFKDALRENTAALNRQHEQLLVMGREMAEMKVLFQRKALE